MVNNGRFRLVSLFKFARAFEFKPWLKLHLTDEIKDDLTWWLQTLRAAAPQTPLPSLETPALTLPILHRSLVAPFETLKTEIYVDASDTAVGFVIGRQHCLWPLKSTWRSDGSNIDVPEAAALELALLFLFDSSPNLRNITIRVNSDNSVVEKGWKSRRSNSAKVNRTLSRIHDLVGNFECSLQVEYVPSSLNKADLVSRGGDPLNSTRVFPTWDVMELPRELDEIVVFTSRERKHREKKF